MKAFASSASRTLSLEIHGTGPKNLISLDFATRAGLALSELCAIAAPGAQRLDLSFQVTAASASLRLVRCGGDALHEPDAPSKNPLLCDLITQLRADLRIEADNVIVLTVPVSVVLEGSIG